MNRREQLAGNVSLIIADHPAVTLGDAEEMAWDILDAILPEVSVVTGLTPERLAEFRRLAVLAPGGYIRDLLAAYDESQAEVKRQRLSSAQIAQWREKEQVEAENLRTEVKRLRAQVIDVLEDGDHGLFCDSHYDHKPCTCWHSKVSKIVGYES